MLSVNCTGNEEPALILISEPLRTPAPTSPTPPPSAVPKAAPMPVERPTCPPPVAPTIAPSAVPSAAPPPAPTPVVSSPLPIRPPVVPPVKFKVFSSMEALKGILRPSGVSTEVNLISIFPLAPNLNRLAETTLVTLPSTLLPAGTTSTPPERMGDASVASTGSPTTVVSESRPFFKEA